MGANYIGNWAFYGVDICDCDGKHAIMGAEEYLKQPLLSCDQDAALEIQQRFDTVNSRVRLCADHTLRIYSALDKQNEKIFVWCMQNDHPVVCFDHRQGLTGIYAKDGLLLINGIYYKKAD